MHLVSVQSSARQNTDTDQDKQVNKASFYVARPSCQVLSYPCLSFSVFTVIVSNELVTARHVLCEIQSFDADLIVAVITTIIVMIMMGYMIMITMMILGSKSEIEIKNGVQFVIKKLVTVRRV